MRFLVTCTRLWKTRSAGRSVGWWRICFLALFSVVSALLPLLNSRCLILPRIRLSCLTRSVASGESIEDERDDEQNSGRDDQSDTNRTMHAVGWLQRLLDRENHLGVLENAQSTRFSICKCTINKFSIWEWQIDNQIGSAFADAQSTRFSICKCTINQVQHLRMTNWQSNRFSICKCTINQVQHFKMDIGQSIWCSICKYTVNQVQHFTMHN